jgi:hypothetical protein
MTLCRFSLLTLLARVEIRLPQDETGADQSISGAFQNRHKPLQTGRNPFK